jgi:hypothetical protein
MKEDKRLTRALDLLSEIISQEFVHEALWDYKELRRWRKKTIRLFEQCGYVDVTKQDAEAENQRRIAKSIVLNSEDA